VGRLDVFSGPSGVAAVGVNGMTQLVANTSAEGDWIAYGGYHSVARMRVDGSLASEGSAHWVGDLTVGQDLSVAHDVSGVGSTTVSGTLRVGGTEKFTGASDLAARGDYTPLAGPPCACDAASIFDVAAAVEAARLASGPTTYSNVGSQEILLTSGSYYFDNIESVGSITFVIDGAVSLFIDGSLDTVGNSLVQFQSGAQLDLFVSGEIKTVGNLNLGEASDPGALRIYIGGSESTAVAVGNQTFHGSIYAPQAEIAYVGDTEVVGSVFARSIRNVGALSLYYGASDNGPSSCEPPQPQPPREGDGGGNGGGQDEPPVTDIIVE